MAAGGAAMLQVTRLSAQQTGGVFEALQTEAADCEVRRVQFVPGGADVRAL